MAQTGRGLDLRAAVCAALVKAGPGVLGNAAWFNACVLDLADETLPEVSIATRQMDDQLLAPPSRAPRRPAACRRSRRRARRSRPSSRAGAT